MKKSIRIGKPTNLDAEFRSKNPDLYNDIVAAACRALLEEKKTSQEIAEALSARFGISISRETPFKLFAAANKEGRLIYVAARNAELEGRLKQRCAKFGVRDVIVVNSTEYDDIAYHTAAAVQILVQGLGANKPHVRIGWSGGHLFSLAAKHLAARFKSEAIYDLPKRIIFHTLVGSLDVTQPMLHPNSYCIYFDQSEIRERVDCQFYALFAPLLGRQETVDHLLEERSIKEAISEANKLDLILSSVGLRGGKNNLLQNMHDSAESPEGKASIGDFLALPFGLDGPISSRHFSFRPLTLLDADNVADLIRGKNTQLLLAAGPCQGEPKEAYSQLRTPVIRAVIRRCLTTQVVLDYASAKDLLDGNNRID